MPSGFRWHNFSLRASYLPYTIIVLLVLFVYIVIHLEWLSSIITSVSTFAGILFCAVPQIRQNYKLQNVFSLKVPTEGLMLWQLGTGVSTARYAMYVGDKSAYKYAGMYFIDRIGKEILAREGIIEFTSYEEFIRVVLKYPLDFMGIYGRHFVNMLYPVFPNQYIKDIQNEKGIYLVLFYTVFFISCFYLLKMIGERKLRLGWLGILIFPCLCILPGAVEIRFFIALHFVINMFGIIGIKDFIFEVKRHKNFILLYILVAFYYIFHGAVFYYQQLMMALP